MNKRTEWQQRDECMYPSHFSTPHKPYTHKHIHKQHLMLSFCWAGGRKRMMRLLWKSHVNFAINLDFGFHFPLYTNIILYCFHGNLHPSWSHFSSNRMAVIIRTQTQAYYNANKCVHKLRHLSQNNGLDEVTYSKHQENNNGTITRRSGLMHQCLTLAEVSE